MNQATKRKLVALRADYEAVAGHPFEHFHCPILWRDEDVALCRAHIINSAFRESDRCWTIQRKDVDSFYGAMFESDFVTIQERGKHGPVDVFTNKELARRLRPKLVVDGKEIDHYLAEGPVPSNFSELVVEGGQEPIRFALKLEPSETLAALDGNWEIHIEKDVRVAALASLLKAAHLTLFDLLGYQYGLSAGGHFLGRTILGDFFLANVNTPKTRVLENAQKHFGEFVNMVRPIMSAPTGLKGTLTDRLMYVCASSEGPWALLVIIKTGDLLHAVLVPLFEEAESAATFLRFLEKPFPHMEAKLALLKQDHWEVSKSPKRFTWPDADLS